MLFALIASWCNPSAALIQEAEVSRQGAELNHPVVLGWERFNDLESPLRDNVEDHHELLGAVLLSELSCTACHATSRPLAVPPKQGPRLDGIGARRSADWLRTFLSNPNLAKPGTTMPYCLEGSDERVIDSLVALLSLSDSPLLAPIPISKDEDPASASAQRGQQLFHRLGCVACHELPDQTGSVELDDSPDRISFHAMRQRYTLLSLTQFLREPLVVNPHSRMPDQSLSILEAADIAAFLLSPSASSTVVLQTAEVDPGLVEQGRREFRERGCANCHQLDNLDSSLLAPDVKSLSDFQAGCLSESASRAPAWQFSSEQINSLKAALKALQADLANEKRTDLAESGNTEREQSVFQNPVDRLDAQLIVYNCVACHWRLDAYRQRWGGVAESIAHEFRNVGDYDLGDEGRLPPTLHGVGAKLNEMALTEMITGTRHLRPYLQSRMPRYPETLARELTAALIEVDRSAFTHEAAELHQIADWNLGETEVGLAIVNQSCSQCHPISGQSRVGVIGVDLQGAASRLNASWFEAYLRAPGFLRPGTRMPEFFPQSRSSLPEIAQGNVDRQIAGLWRYLSAEAPEIPSSILADQQRDFVLRPQQFPILQRTFFERVSTAALAIGFPQQINLAVDMNEGRLRRLWQGNFIDAHGTWFDRFAPPAKPLGVEVMLSTDFGAWGMVRGERSGTESSWSWSAHRSTAGLGYELDARRNPVILQRVDSKEISLLFETLEYPPYAADVGRSALCLQATWTGEPADDGLRFAFWLGPGSFDDKSRELRLEQVRVRVERGQLIQTADGWCLLPEHASSNSNQEGWRCKLLW